jgi:disulfide bond formation protein DsbB
MSTTVRPDPHTAASATGAPRPQIDPRGARVAATLTTVVLAVALLLSPSAATVVLLAVQALVFAIGAGRGVQHTPYAWLFKTLLRPRLGAPAELEHAAPPRFAQTVGLAFAVVALAGYLLGTDLVGAVATGFALAAAFLNAAFGFCLGCELYLRGKRLTTR